jgi:hypothetical protein
VRHFNAPPGWPQPPTIRWRPPKRWSPHEFWPPAPADWPFWVDEGGRRVKGPLGRYGGPSLRPLVATAATAGVLVVCGFVLFSSFGGSDDTTQGTALPSVSDTDIPPPPTVALPSLGETASVVTPTVTPTPSPRPLLTTVSLTPSTPSTSPMVTSQRAELPARSRTVTAIGYRNCAEVRAAGKAPLHRGDPGYSRKLDKNGDGVACEHGNS